MCHDFDPVQGLDCCHYDDPFTPQRRICCDCNGRYCSRYDEESRDCFWPNFTHPTWPCCDILYGCDPLTRTFSENEPPDDDDGLEAEETVLRRRRRRRFTGSIN